MSIKRMSAVWDHSQHKGSELLLMLALADIANDIGVAWPGYPYLAHKIRMARRSAIRLAGSCAKTGELWILNRAHHRSNIYIVTVGLTALDLTAATAQALKMGAIPTTDSDILTPPPQVLVVTNCHQVGTEFHHSVTPVTPSSDTAMSPDPSLPIITQSEKDNRAFAFLWSPVLDALELIMTKATFDTWLRGSRLVATNNGTWTVDVRHTNAAEWIANRLYPSSSFQNVLRAHAPQVEHIEFIAREEQV